MACAWYTQDMVSAMPRYSVFHIYHDGNHTVCGKEITSRWYISPTIGATSTKICPLCAKKDKNAT